MINHIMLLVLSIIWTEISSALILRDQPDYIASSSKKYEAILYSCFINNAATEVIIHNTVPKHFKSNQNIESLHEGLSLSISTFACYQYTHLNFTFSLQLFQNLYHKNGGFKIYKDGKLQHKPNTKQRYRSFLGDFAVFEYTDQSSSPTNIKQGKVSLTFLGDISIFSQENKANHLDLYKCQSFSAQLWTQDILYDIKPIPTSKSSYSTSSLICNTMILFAIPTSKIDTFSRNSLNPLISNHINSQRRQLSEYNGLINRFDCSSWDDQWRHHHSVKIGLVIDQGFYDKFGNSDDLLDEYISLMFTNTNGLFEPQLNVHIAIGDVLVAHNIPNYGGTIEWWMDAPTEGAEDGGCDLQSNQFTLIKNWNGAKWNHDYANCTAAGYDYTTLSNCSYIDKNAAWILLSRCFHGAGIATVGRLCRTGRTSAAAVNYERDETWLVFAHELGHLFGAAHYFDDGNGGIMDYTAQTYQGIHQFRIKDDICSGIQTSRSGASNMRPQCWETYDYGSLSYKWRQNGNYSSCQPLCGEMQFKVEVVECVMSDEYGTISRTVDDKNCGLDLKPFGKFLKCEESEVATCSTNVCGNGLWEIDEECDSLLLDQLEIDNECCQTDCSLTTTDHCVRLKKQIDAAFTDSNGKLYLFQGSQYAVYSDLGDGTIGSPDTGYPKYILDSFPITAWNGDFDAAFCTSDNIVYIFKDFSYIRIDLDAINIETGNAQIDDAPNPIVMCSSSDHTLCEFEFGYIPQEFVDCGRIDAAFVHSINQVTIICGTIYYTWTIAAPLQFENIYRPFFSDYQIDFGDSYRTYLKVDAASYNWTQQTLRFYAADVYIEHVNGEQNGDENRLSAMGYWADTMNCGMDNCGNCDLKHNGKCYDSSYLVVIQFESIDFDSEHWVSYSSLEYDVNGGVFSGSNAAIFATDTNIILKSSGSLYSVITNWKMSAWLYPTNYTEEQDFFHIIDEYESHTIFKLTTNSECINDEQLTIKVTHTNANSDGDLIVFEDTDCIIPLSLNQWSKVTFDAVSYMVTVTVNSNVQTSQVIESQIDLTINLSSWYLGQNYIGKMDYFIFQETNGYIITIDPTPTPTAPSAAACVFPFVSNIVEMIAWISAFLSLYTVGMWTLYKYYGAKVLLNHIARQFNMQQNQQQFIGNNDNNAGANIEMVMNEQQEVQEVAAGMAIQAIEQVISGIVTPNKPKSKKVENKFSARLLQGERFLSPKAIIYTDEQYDGDQLASPANKTLTLD